MPYTVTHVLTTIILVGLYRDYVTKHKRYFSLHTLFVAGVGGLLPDIDIPIRMVGELLGFDVPVLLQHGGITHTLLFTALFLIPAYFLWKKNKHKSAMYFVVISFGCFLHIFLDYLLGGGNHAGVMWFFPFSMWSAKIHLLKMFGMNDLPVAIESLLLLAWLWHEEVKHKISDFI